MIRRRTETGAQKVARLMIDVSAIFPVTRALIGRADPLISSLIGPLSPVFLLG
jgi:hypothetical protein